jgi:hypothetical protein
MVFDFTQFWLDGRPSNEYFWISHKISDLLTPLTPLGVRPQWFETDLSHSSYSEGVGEVDLLMSLSLDSFLIITCSFEDDMIFFGRVAAWYVGVFGGGGGRVSHYHLEVQANQKKNCTKKTMLFLAFMGETGW